LVFTKKKRRNRCFAGRSFLSIQAEIFESGLVTPFNYHWITDENIFLVGLSIVILQYSYYMGLTKSEIFTEKQNKLASMMKSLAHPARIAIIQHVIKKNSCICGDLVEELGLAQPTISQHLKELKNAGLIQGTIEGTSVCYCIEPKTWAQFKSVFESFFVSYENASRNCC
jgi:DNA-binding transcriptional ArsR family regulator